MNITNLKDNPEYFDQCIEIIEDSFEYDSPHLFKSDFNALVYKDNLENCFFIADKETVIATLFTLPKKLTYKEYATDVLFLGGIAVHPEHRGKGLFKKVFSFIQEKTKNISLYLLWSDLTGLYEKFSFYEFGIIQEERATSSKRVDVSDNINFEDLESKYLKLNDLYITPQRSHQDWELIKSHSSIDKLSTTDGHVFFVHKGMDLQNVIHETYPLDMTNDTPFIKWNYLPDPEATNLLYMGFMKINNFNLFSKFIKEISRNEINLIKKEDETITLSFTNEEFDLHEKILIQGLWGPQYVAEWSKIIPKLIVFGFDAT